MLHYRLGFSTNIKDLSILKLLLIALHMNINDSSIWYRATLICERIEFQMSSIR